MRPLFSLRLSPSRPVPLSVRQQWQRGRGAQGVAKGVPPDRPPLSAVHRRGSARRQPASQPGRPACPPRYPFAGIVRKSRARQQQRHVVNFGTAWHGSRELCAAGGREGDWPDISDTFISALTSGPVRAFPRWRGGAGRAPTHSACLPADKRTDSDSSPERPYQLFFDAG